MRKLLFIALLFAAFPELGKASVENDTLLRVLREELVADFSELQKQDVKPYFMSFRVQETQAVSITSTNGFLGASFNDRKRTFTPQVRLGSAELDNFKFNNQAHAGQCALPLTNASSLALRSAIWLQMLQTYDRAAREYRNVQNRLRSQADNEDKAPCFSLRSNAQAANPVAPAYYEEPFATPAITEAQKREWEDRLCRVSAVFRQWPHFNESYANLQVEDQRTHLVNTEGTVVVQNRRSYRIMIQAVVRTSDGMNLPLYTSYIATSLDSLPSEAVLKRDAEDIGRRLVALESAPVADPYSGPALMSGAASGVFFHEIFGHRLEGHRMKSGGQTFRKMVGQKILPTDFQVYSDPTITHYGGQLLHGSYRYDDEGTPARRVNNVINGVLKEFLMNRIPIDGFPESNGHGRAAVGGDPVSRQSNLIIETSKPNTDAQMRKMLIDEARRQGKEYGYLFQTASSGFTFTGEGNSINSFNVNPLEVYRIYVDGRPDELVRGVDLIGTPLAMFSTIAAGGDTPYTFTGYCGAESGSVPVSATSPMLFCTKIETQRRQQKAELMPILPAPTFSESVTPASAVSSATARDSIIFAAMSDELRRSLDSLRFNGKHKPFIIDTRLKRSHRYNVRAIDGQLVDNMLTPWDLRCESEVILGDYHRSSQTTPEPGYSGGSMPAAIDYDNIRRAIWFLTDTRYKQAIGNFDNKRQELQKATLPQDETALDDLIPANPAVAITHRNPEAEDLHADELAAYVQRLSRIGREFPALTYSVAGMDLQQADIWRLSSEGVRIAQPQDDICHLYFEFRNANGYVNVDNFTRNYSTVAELLADSTSYIHDLRKNIADRLLILSDNETKDDYYVGPLLVESKAGNLIYSAASGGRHIFRAWHPYVNSDREIFAKRNRKILDEKLTIRQEPTLSTWEGKPLVGYFAKDANGQAPQAVTLVDRGIFCAQICGQTPALGTTTPTGNLRFNNPERFNAAMGLSTAPGVLRITSSKTQPMKKMRAQLLSEAQHEGYDHAYIVRDDGSFFRVSVKDGSETPVRRPNNMRISIIDLRRIKALSTEQEVCVQSEDAGPRFSIIAPKAMLLSDIEVPSASPGQLVKTVLSFPKR